MKTRLFFALCTILSAFSAKGQVKTIADLKQGDWFLLEHITFFDSVPGNVWKNEDLQKVTFRAVVRQQTKNELTMVFKPVHLFENQWSKSGKSPNYQYYDSYYTDDINMRNERRHVPQRTESTRQVFTDIQSSDSMLVKINLPAGTVKDTTFTLASGIWYYPCAITNAGFKFGYSYSYSNPLQIADAKALFIHTVVEYLNKWRTSNSMPAVVHPVTEMPKSVQDRRWGRVQTRGKVSSLVCVTGASFDLRPNVYLSYATKESLSGKDMEFSVEGKTFRFAKQKNGSLQCRFFLLAPRKIVFDDVTLLLTPGDSIEFRKDDSGKGIFVGEGSANCRFAQEKANLSRTYPNGYVFFVGQPSIEDVDRRITNVKNIYQTAWEKCGDGMNDYWLTSSQLSCKYWEMSIWLKRAIVMYSHNKKETTVIPWDSASFTTTAPYLDYFYQPEGYDDFINNYFNYKMSQITSDNLSAMPVIYSWDNSAEPYYLQKQMLKDYPRFVQTKNTLKRIMKQKHFAGYEREYNDFMQTCRDPQARAEIEDMRSRLQMLEPGANIRNLGLGLEKYLPLKDQPDGYMMLNFKQEGFEWDKTWTSNLRKTLQNSNLDEKVRIFAFRSAAYKETLPEYMKNSGDYVFIPTAMVQKDLSGLNALGIDFVLISNDGTVVSREINSNFRNMVSLIK